MPQIQKDRLTFVLDRYLARVGTPWDEIRLTEAIDRYLATFPFRDRDGAPERP